LVRWLSQHSGSPPFEENKEDGALARLVADEVSMNNTCMRNMVGLIILVIEACVLEVKDVYMAAELELATCHYHEGIELMRETNQFNEQELALKKKQ
jgi:hypothetical protein